MGPTGRRMTPIMTATPSRGLPGVPGFLGLSPFSYIALRCGPSRWPGRRLGPRRTMSRTEPTNDRRHTRRHDVGHPRAGRGVRAVRRRPDRPWAPAGRPSPTAPDRRPEDVPRPARGAAPDAPPGNATDPADGPTASSRRGRRKGLRHPAAPHPAHRRATRLLDAARDHAADAGFGQAPVAALRGAASDVRSGRERLRSPDATEGAADRNLDSIAGAWRPRSPRRGCPHRDDPPTSDSPSASEPSAATTAPASADRPV